MSVINYPEFIYPVETKIKFYEQFKEECYYSDETICSYNMASLLTKFLIENEIKALVSFLELNKTEDGRYWINRSKSIEEIQDNNADNEGMFITHLMRGIQYNMNTTDRIYDQFLYFKSEDERNFFLMNFNEWFQASGSLRD